MWPHERKLRRAAAHFEQLRAQIIGWEEGQGYTLRVLPDPRPPHYVIRVQINRPVEEEPFPLVLGDFLQNARASLDYIATALGDVGAGGVMSESDAAATMFPIASAPEQFARIVERRLPTVTEPVRKVIADVQPYETGGDLWQIEPLWILNELARFDRHRYLHVGYERIGSLALNEGASRNVRIEDPRIAEGSISDAELEAWEDAQLAQAEGREVVEGAILGRFAATPIDPSLEMHMEWESAIQIGLVQDALPATLPHTGGALGDNIPWLGKEILRDIREVFLALSPFLPADAPSW
jgi:hypothetical protein